MKKNKNISSFSELVINSSSPTAKEMAITKRGKGGAFRDKRFQKKSTDKWKIDVKEYM